MTHPVDEQSDQDKAKEEAFAFERELEHEIPHIYVTPALIAANVAVYLLLCLKGVDFWQPDFVPLVRWGANYGPLTVERNEWWRLVTSMFLHAGLLHIALNMLALWTSGRIVERLYGPAWFALLYALCGLGASLAGLWHHADVPSVGASGAIVGIYGCLLAFMLHPNAVLSTAARNAEVKSLVSFFAYLLVAGIRNSGVDTAAHVGGAVIGFIAGLGFSAWLKPRLPHPAAAAVAARGRARRRPNRAAVHKSHVR